MRENRESQHLPTTEGVVGGRGKADGRQPRMHEGWQSDSSILPTKSANKGAKALAESMEGKDGAEGNTDQQNTSRTQSRSGVPNTLERVRQAAKRDRKAKLTALMHHVTVERLRQGYSELKRHAAPRVDGVTWTQYHAIPKADGKQRPLGIASLEDKILQRAMVQVLNAIYEVDCLGFSYGFRLGRSQHDALDALAVALYDKKVTMCSMQTSAGSTIPSTSGG